MIEFTNNQKEDLDAIAWHFDEERVLLRAAEEFGEASVALLQYARARKGDGFEVVADMEAQCTRRELGENIQETFRHVDKICRFDPEALWTVAPDYARNAQKDEPEPVKAVEGRRALTFMHGSPVIGYVVRDGERVIWREPKTETNLPITGPVLCLLASPDEELWAWRKTNS